MTKKRNYKVLFVVILLFSLSVPMFAAPRVGLVLGGGAARGFSHIGLIKAFEENGIPIDLLVGTSMGSIVSSLYAAGYSTENMQQIVATLDTAALVDLGIPPKGGLINTSRLQHYLNILLANKTFDQLGIPFYSVITNVRTGEEVALNDGLVSTGVQASMSIPALFPPVLIDGHYYVDGGMKNAVPANVAKNHGADVILAVDVKKDLETIDYDSVLTNLQLSMWFMIDGYVQANTADADVIIVPDVQYDSYMDFPKVELFIEEGYLAGLAYMEQIKEAILKQDPAFEFIPYAQRGFTSQEIASITQRAEREAINLPRPFSISPEVSLEPLGEFPQVGIKLGHGFLSWFSLGYRYGLNNTLGGHEAFVEWSKNKLGLGVFVRSSPGLTVPTWGAHVDVPLTENWQLAAAYLSQGTTAWQLSTIYEGILKHDHLSLDLGAKLDKERGEAEPLIASLTPVIKLFAFAEPRAALEVALVRPYVYGSVEMATPIVHLDTRLAYELGVGSEIRLFGLYPVEMSVGFKTGAGQTSSWRLKVKGGSF